MSPTSSPIIDDDFASELEAFGQDVDMESLDFNDVMNLLVGYTRDVLLTPLTLDRLEAPGQVRAELRDILSNAQAFVGADASAEQTKATRVRAWRLHDGLPASGGSRRLAELMVLCCYDRESAEFDTFGPEPMIESIMTSLARLGPGYCRSFRLFAAKRLAGS